MATHDDALSTDDGGEAVLPRELVPLFWDTDVSELDLDRDAHAIVERVLRLGRPEHLRWLLARYPAETIARVVRRSVNLDRRSAQYWRIRMRIPEEDVRCLNKSSHIAPWNG